MPIDRTVLCNFRSRKPREQLESVLKSFKIKVNNTVFTQYTKIKDKHKYCSLSESFIKIC